MASVWAFAAWVAVSGGPRAAGAQPAADPGMPGLTARPLSPPSTQGAGSLVGFTRLDPARTGISFTNRLEGDAFLTNAVAHNGSGVAVGDVDGDGRPDVYLCALQGSNRLFLNRGELRFEERPIGAAACPDQMSTGAVLADVDGDDDLDLLVNGIGAGTRLFRNDGKGTFTEGTDTGLSRTATPMSMALADIDGDGDLDVVLTASGGAPRLLRNDQRLGHHWIQLRLEGSAKNRDAYGATARLFVDGQILRRDVNPSRSYMSQSDTVLSFGLGTATKIDKLEIRWPDGDIQTATELAIDQRHTLKKSSSPAK